jgi:hypothetical protein
MLCPRLMFLCCYVEPQLEFRRRAKRKPALLRLQRRHMRAAAAGGICFVLEEAFPRLPLIHSAWHVLSAYGVASTNHLLADVEAEQA